MISDLKPKVEEAVNRAFDELRRRKIPFSCPSDIRKTWEQLLYYMQTRASLEIINLWREFWEVRLLDPGEEKRWATNCDGLHRKSAHQSGESVDVVPAENGRPVWPPKDDPRWSEISEVMKAHGFSWGGDWAEPDYPHYEMRGVL